MVAEGKNLLYVTFFLSSTFPRSLGGYGGFGWRKIFFYFGRSLCLLNVTEACALEPFFTVYEDFGEKILSVKLNA